jgi:alcohol dehydrogenase
LAGKLAPEKLIGKKISLQQSAIDLPRMNEFQELGLTIIDPYL